LQIGDQFGHFHSARQAIDKRHVIDPRNAVAYQKKVQRYPTWNDDIGAGLFDYVVGRLLEFVDDRPRIGIAGKNILKPESRGDDKCAAFREIKVLPWS
jgi:hypothetical protein